MNRVSKRNKDKIEIQNRNEADERLARFEDFYFDLMKEQEKLTQQLNEMRENMLTKQYRYREMSAQKVANQFVLNKLKQYGLE